MKLSEILDILSAANLPALTRDQLLQLAGTNCGKKFAADLEAFAAGAGDRRDDIAAVVHSLGDSCKGALEQLRFEFVVDEVVAIAKQEKRQFFSALHAVSSSSPRKAEAVQYLNTVGLPRAAGERVPAVAPETSSAPPYYSFKIFGGSAALCVSEARTRSGNLYTIQIEGAALLAGAGRKEFDWRNKIIVQLTVQEAYLALALFENLIPSVNFNGHGGTHDKALQIEFQESHYYVRVIQRGRAAVALPVSAVDAIPIVALLYKQLLSNEQHLRIKDIRALVARMASMSCLPKPR